MKVLLLPNAFKGALSAIEACKLMEDALQSNATGPLQLQSFPMADGGDGTAEVLQRLFGGVKKEIAGVDAMGEPAVSCFIWHEARQEAYVDLASQVGIALLKPGTLNPRLASSFGLGLCMKAISDFKPSKIILGLGGSASIDGGLGLLAALGFSFSDESGSTLHFQAGKTDLIPFIKAIKRIHPPKNAASFPNVEVLLDVRHPVLGRMGCVHKFGKQKGLVEPDFLLFETSLRKWARVMNRENLLYAQGMGAAGACPLGLSLLPKVHFQPGADYLLSAIHLDEIIHDADLIISTEGRLDQQSLNGKLTGQVLHYCKKYSKDLWLLVGEDALSNPPENLKVISINNPTLPLETNMKQCPEHLEEAVKKILDLIPPIDCRAKP
jgi:glycerate kinase